MKRRDFIRTGGTAALIGSGLAIGANSFGGAIAATSEISVETIKKIRDRIHPISASERNRRMENALRLMKENKMDYLIMEPGTSLRYFTGVYWGRSERLFAGVLSKEGNLVIIAPKFEEQRAKEQSGKYEVLTWKEDQSPYLLFKKIFGKKNQTDIIIGIEESTRYFVFDNLKKNFPELKITSGTPVTAGCRMVKSEEEIELMQVANDMAAEVFTWSVSQLKEGMTEAEFGEIITTGFRMFGVGGGALVLFGDASALPHGHVKENRLKKGDIVLMDGGCSVEDYESDITRTTVFGKASPKMEKVFAIVRKAQDEALKAAKPGVSAKSVDEAARKYITSQGYGDGYKFFTHRLGHGIGMDGHEWEYLVGGNEYVLKTGNIFSNEPGIYLPGEFGIRVEDEMLITETGARLLLPQQESLYKMF